MKETELKPCKCGCEAELVESQAFSWCDVTYFVRCTNDNCDERTVLKYEDKIDAINAWNRKQEFLLPLVEKERKEQTMSKEINELKSHLDTMIGNSSQLKAEKLVKLGYRRQSEGEWVFKNSPFEMLDMAFKRLFPNVKYTAYFEPNIRDGANGEEVCGLTDFADDGEITIFIDTDLSINNSVEIFAHELAHAGVGVEHDHDEMWEKAFDDLFEEYNKIGDEMFSSNINAPKGEDYSNALAKMKGGAE